MKLWRKSRIGLWLALVAAYALAINIVLASSSSASAQSQSNVICHAVDDHGSSNDTDRPIGNLLPKCAICLANHFNAALPGAQPPLVAKTTFFATVEYFGVVRFAEPGFVSNHSARGPPAIV